MMMNFKKNQNNAVCSMDCKNCPHGASQPNPMDDPMFEKSIAMLHIYDGFSSDTASIASHLYHEPDLCFG